MQTLSPRMKGGDGDLPAGSVFSMHQDAQIYQARCSSRDQEDQQTRNAQELVSREAFLQASHQYEERYFGCRAKTACVFSSADKSREEKDANISGMCPAAFCASTLEYNTNVTKKDSTE